MLFQGHSTGVSGGGFKEVRVSGPFQGVSSAIQRYSVDLRGFQGCFTGFQGHTWWFHRVSWMFLGVLVVLSRLSDSMRFHDALQKFSMRLQGVS